MRVLVRCGVVDVVRRVWRSQDGVKGFGGSVPRRRLLQVLLFAHVSGPWAWAIDATANESEICYRMLQNADVCLLFCLNECTESVRLDEKIG